MKRFLLTLSLLAASSQLMAADVGVSVSIGQPGFYGHIDIGDTRPQVIYARPVIIERAPAVVVQEPLYLRVPPGHAKHWRDHCREYDACGRQVYFVRDTWYNNVYVPHYREQHGEYEHQEDRDRRGDRGDDRRERHDNGHGEGHGNGHGKGHDRD